MILMTFGQTPSQAVLVPYALTTIVLFVLVFIPSQAGLISWAGGGWSKWRQRELEIEEWRSADERLRNVYELTSILSATLSYERVLNALLDTSAMGLDDLGGDRMPGIVFLYSPKGKLYVSASRHLQAGDQDIVVSEPAGMLEHTLKNAEPTTGDSVADDPELSKFRSLRSARSLLCVPLRAGFEIFGAVLLASPTRNAFTQNHIELINAVANQAVIALQNARLYQNVQEDKQRIMDAQEETRRQLARELHDGPTQSVSAIAMRLNFTKILVTRQPERAAVELEKLEALARRTAKEIRTMLFALRPLALEAQGLTPALEQYAEKLRETEGIEVHIESSSDERLPSKTEGIVFSIVEEAINNARKHARADNIYVRLYVQQDQLVTEVEDDGRGFDLSSVTKSYEQRGSLGLVNMRERAGLVSGSFTIKSEPGKGTLVTLLVPLSEDERDGD
jgi:signal transduction histidine kinase